MTTDSPADGLLIARVGDVMSSSSRSVQPYASDAVTSLLAYARENDVPELETVCAAELQRRAPRQAPPPPVPCRWCREPVRQVRQDDDPAIRGAGWVHVSSRQRGCDFYPVATPQE